LGIEVRWGWVVWVGYIFYQKFNFSTYMFHQSMTFEWNP